MRKSSRFKVIRHAMHVARVAVNQEDVHDPPHGVAPNDRGFGREAANMLRAAM